MKANELRAKFLKYFEEKGHAVMPSAPLIPENDPSVLFTTAGMHPLVPFLLGEKHPLGKRLTNAQKCIRTGDIDEVGDKIHHTFFEMLGNWSLGDYFKKEAINWSFEFLTSKDGLDIDLNNFAVSVFAGDEDASFDEESYNTWRGLGVADERIAKLPKKNNWWGPAGEVGPCGTDSEMFVWSSEEPAPINFQETCDDPNWVEVWNNVFMQYNKVKTETGFAFEKLAQHNVDTGMGLERALAVLNKEDDNYRTDLFWPIILEIENLSHKKYDENTLSFRIIADHLKAATFAIGDGAIPSNKAAGYIVRRLIRRAIVKAQHLGITENFTTKIADKVFEIYEGIYFYSSSESEKPDSSRQASNNKKELVKAELEKEETKFRRTLANGLKMISSKEKIDGKDLFDLYQSFGLPLEISLEEAKNRGLTISDETIEEFNKLVKEHQALSRTASAGMFKGGLTEASEQTTKYHTATHLLLAALRQVLGDHVLQRGSNITAERMRFDFSHPAKMTPEEIKQVEDIVNENITADLAVDMQEMNLEDAKNCGAMGIFESKYGDRVKVYTIQSPQGGGAISREICGGPHVERTGLLGKFKIVKEEASSAGIRRIKAVLE